jgi:hypothetical protein
MNKRLAYLIPGENHHQSNGINSSAALSNLSIDGDFR